jgi:protein-S-isoprenylcysteine O-methyltransferase Ste14
MHIFPWVIQILAGITWLNYAKYQKDVFLFIANIPALVVAIAVTMKFHPYLRKRIRKSQEMALIVGLTLVTLVTVGTSVSTLIPENVTRYSLGGLAGACTLIMALVSFREIIRVAFGENQPPANQLTTGVLGLLFGGVWVAYGLIGSNPDPFIYVPHILWVIYSVLQILLIGFAGYRQGGFETETFEIDEEEEEDDDVTVRRLNRASTVSSFGGNSSMQRRGNRNSQGSDYSLDSEPKR